MTDSQGLHPLRRRIFAIVAISLGSAMLMIDAVIAGVTLPTIAESLGIRGSATLLVVTAYQLVLAMTLLPLAAIGDRVGYRRLFQAGLALHASAGILCLAMDSLTGLILVRALQALGAAMALAVSVAMLRSIYPATRLGSGLALNTIFNASGTALAPVLGGLIVSVADWQWVFAALAPLALLSLAFSGALPDPEQRQHPLNLAGAILCATTFGLLIAGLEGVVHTDHMTLSLGVILLGVGAAALLFRHERRALHPVLPVDLLARPALGLAALATFIGTLGSMALILYMPFLLQQGHGFTPGEIGGLMSAYAVASVMFAPLAGALSDRIPVAILCTLGMTISAIGLAAVALIPDQPDHLDVAWRLWLCGAGFGMFFSPNARFLVGSAPRERAAAAGSLYSTARMLAMACGATLVAALLASGKGSGALPALMAMGLVVATGLISATGLGRQTRSPSP